MSFLDGVVVKAFARLTERQQRQGYSPAVEDALARAVSGLRMTTKDHEPRLDSAVVRQVRDAFMRLFFNDQNTWLTSTWRGTTTWKCPTDVWIYQELIHELRPGLIIEAGTAFGGSASYMATLLDLAGRGRIVSIDIAPKAPPPEHPRITYLTASSTDPATVERVRDMLPTDGEPVMVILDSDHSEHHVYDELMAYADMVTPGSYLLVEDTTVNGHPVFTAHGPGPMEALNRFLAERDDFEIDPTRTRYHLTFNPRGYLRRKVAS